jgi:hypothetical protein
MISVIPEMPSATYAFFLRSLIGIRSMAQVYSDPSRQADPYSLPDVELWEDYIVEIDCPCCGVHEVPYESAYATETLYCPSCGLSPDGITAEATGITAFWYWYCFPGCLPDSDVYGPYNTEKEAMDEIQSDSE